MKEVREPKVVKEEDIESTTFHNINVEATNVSDGTSRSVTLLFEFTDFVRVVQGTMPMKVKL